MKTISKLALAAVLAGGMSGPILAKPAPADKKKDEKAGGLKLSPAVQKPGAAAEAAIAARDLATAETQVAAAEAAATGGSEDDKFIVASLRLRLELAKQNEQRTANPNASVSSQGLVGPLEALLASPRAPADARAAYAFQLGAIAYDARQYARAVPYLEQARQLGFTKANLDEVIFDAKVNSNDVKGALGDLNMAIERQKAAGQVAPESFYKKAFGRALNAKLNADAFEWLKKWLTAYPTSKNWHDAVFIYGLQKGSISTPDNQQQIDLWRLLRVSKGLADQYGYIEYAQKAFDRGLPGEAASVLKEGQASGKLAGSADTQALLTAALRAQREETSLVTLSKQAQASADGKLASQTADAYLSQDNFAAAIPLYRAALQKGGANNDQVNVRLGIALARSGDKAGAQAAFGAVTTGVRGEIAQLWLTWLNAPPVA